VSAGGRTGLTAVFVAIFFLLTLFFFPLAAMVPAYASAAALLYVACVMTQGLAEIAWDDITEYAPAVVTAIAMPALPLAAIAEPALIRALETLRGHLTVIIVTHRTISRESFSEVDMDKSSLFA
jgi:hypothetical protein